MGNKLTRILLVTIIILVILTVIARFFYNKQVNKYSWDEDDREMLVNGCIDDAAHYAVRFPALTKEYCSCTADSIMSNMKKAEYLQVSVKSFAEKQKVLLPFITECYNNYQTQIFEQTELGDL